MQRILVAIDGSDCSRRAAAAGADLASRLGAQVAFVYAVPPPPVMGETAMVDLVALEEAHADYAKKLLAEVAAASARPGLAIATRILHGPAPEAINDAAREGAADLIVVGSRGRNALTRAILGSVAHALVQTSKKPVLVVH